MSTPYWEGDGIRLYHGDSRNVLEWLTAAVLVTDPPYGIGYNSGSRRETLAASIVGDEDTTLRDDALEAWGDRPALVFGTWRIPRPEGTRARLIWDTKGALGMGDLSIPWKPSDQEIYVLGHGFRGHRGSNVITCAPVQSMGTNGRLHPHQKPVPLMAALLAKCPPGVIADPFSGVGSTLVAVVADRVDGLGEGDPLRVQGLIEGTPDIPAGVVFADTGGTKVVVDVSALPGLAERMAAAHTRGDWFGVTGRIGEVVLDSQAELSGIY